MKIVIAIKANKIMLNKNKRENKSYFECYLRKKEQDLTAIIDILKQLT